MMLAIIGSICLVVAGSAGVWYVAHWMSLGWYIALASGTTLCWVVGTSVVKERRMLKRLRASSGQDNLVDFHRKQQGSAAPYIPETAESLDAKWRGIDHEDRGR
jgi:hypothetical protein